MSLSGTRSYTEQVTTGHDDRNGELPSGSVVPSADIWDDDESTGQGEAWLVEAQVVVHESDATAGDVTGKLADDLLYDGREDQAAAGRMLQWGRSNAFGAGLAAIGLGIEKAVFAKEQIEIEIQHEADDDEPDKPLTVDLDQDHPERSVATLRPWLDRKPD